MIFFILYDGATGRIKGRGTVSAQQDYKATPGGKMKISRKDYDSAVETWGEVDLRTKRIRRRETR